MANGIEIVGSGGKMKSNVLTTELLKKNEGLFMMSKAMYWMKMLNAQTKPVHWYQTTKKGTNVSFVDLQTPEEYEDALAELKTFIAEANEKYGLEMKIKEEEQADA